MFKHFNRSIIRYISAKFSDYLISNGKDQLEQLSRWKVKGEIKEISTNTIHDSVLQTKIDIKRIKVIECWSLSIEQKI